jgi:hypothetical protein
MKKIILFMSLLLALQPGFRKPKTFKMPTGYLEMVPV